MINQIIKENGQQYINEYKEILEKIKKYNKIAIFRHIKPDFDALGTQFGLATWIKDNFKDKDVKCLGDNHVTFTPSGLFPETDKLNESWYNDDFGLYLRPKSSCGRHLVDMASKHITQCAGYAPGGSA